MPNFNGAIIMHTLQLMKAPATLREIVMTIAKNIDMPQDDLMMPVKQTLEMGSRLGFLQKLNGRYFLVPMTFETLMSEMKSMGQPARKTDVWESSTKPKVEKRTIKQQRTKLESLKKTELKNLGIDPSLPDEHDSTTTLMPTQSMQFKPDALLRRQSDRSYQLSS